MKLTVLVENSVCESNQRCLKSEHGLSLYVHFNGKNVLFDVGQSDLFIANAKQLQIDLSQVDYLIVSHGHYDHGGGLEHFLALNKTAKVYIHQTATHKYYSKNKTHDARYIGLDARLIGANQDRISLIDSDCQISDKISVLQDFPESFPRSEMNNTLYAEGNNELIPDLFMHELCLVLEGDTGLFVFTACSHSGLPNILEKVKKQFTNKKIVAVFGGFHIHSPGNNKDAKPEYIDKLMLEITKYSSLFYTGHCTGKQNFDYMKSKLGNKIRTMNTGEVIVIE